jgi:hypothetical protein
MERIPQELPFDRYNSPPCQWDQSISSFTNLPDREPRSAGYPPMRYSRQSDPLQSYPGQVTRYSDPGPTVSGHYRSRTDNRNHSVASTVSSLSSNSSSNSSLFGNSYSMSSGMLTGLNTDKQ